MDNLGPLAQRLGITLERGTEYATASMPVAGNEQPFGALHGGATLALIETVGSVAALAHARQRECVPVGVEVHATHHRAVTTGRVTACATPLHEGGRVASYRVDVTDEEGHLVASGTVTNLLVTAPR